MAIQIKSFNQILGDMIRKIIAETALNDLNAGSVLLTLLEAAASNDFENNTAILNVLELLNIDAIKNNDLDAKAGDFGLSRRTAIKASGLVDIYNTNITKRSTGLYVIKPAPIAGQTKIYVNNTTGWSLTGSLYIGRGTQSFEGPITYTSIVVFPTYSEITLGSALQKDHLISDSVIDSQGQPDILINAGTNVNIPANNQNPEINYITLRDAIIPSGEDKVSGVSVIAIVAGSLGNAGINTITNFDVPPFSGAGVSNTSAFSSGRDIETDTELRNRLKSYSITLARGTAPSIISAVIGVSDPDDSNQVASAVITEPIKVGDPSILYIDDGSGFQPSFAGQSVDKLLNNAVGSEEFLQLANYPLPRPQVINVDEGPFTIIEGSFLRVSVDGQEETIYFDSTQFLNISAATLSEIIIVINTNSTLFKARFANNSTGILLYPVEHDAEIIQVAPLRSTDDPTLYANTLLKFPTDEFSYISLYKNSELLREKAIGAELETASFAQWNITSVGNIIIAVDNTPTQDRNFALSDFPGAVSFASLSLQDWVDTFNSKFAGLTAEATPSQTMIIRSNKIGAESSIVVSGGTLLNKWFPNLPLESQGQTAQFELNRQTGNLRILADIVAGDSISAGIEDAKGFAVSAATTSGNYNLSSDGVGRPAEMVIVVDSTYCNKKAIPLLIGSNISILASGSTMTITSDSADSFAALKPGDFIYLVKRTAGWISAANSGLFKIKAKGNHTAAGIDTYVVVDNDGAVTEGGIPIADSLDIKAFETDGFPQIWRGSYLANPPAEPITGVLNSLNEDVAGVLATIFRSNSIKITSTSENSGSLAIPISIGNASVFFTETDTAQLGNPSHIATRVSDKTLVSLFKATSPTATNVFLDRHIYADVKGALSSNAVPDVSPFAGTYSETVQSTGVLTPANVDFDDYLSFTRGNNRNQFRTIKAKIAVDQVGTQQSTARTELDHIALNEFELVRPVSISSEDSIVVVMDKDATINTVDVRMSRTGIVNSGSNPGAFVPTTTEFSANDQDNEPGIDFNNTNVWGTIVNGTDFSDYAVWLRARNWYSTGGVAGSGGKMLVRSAQYGPNGEKIRFNIEYPTSSDQAGTTTFINTPSYSLYSYYFGSGPARATTIGAGDTIAVKGPYPDTATNFPNGAVSAGDYFDYTFSAGTLATVSVGDVLSITDGSGVSASNSGQFSVTNKSGLTVRVFNPSASITTPGAAEVTTVTTVADIIGTPTSFTINTVADIAGSLHQTYFIVYDTQGSVAVWYDIDNVGAVAPPHGANRAIKVATVVTGDSANDVATKTGQAIALDNAFSVGVITNQITITNLINGALASASAGTSGFTPATITGTADNSLDGKYFILHDAVGSVAVWYDVGNDGTSEPFHGADRSIRVSGVNYGDSATTVAAATVADVNPDLSFIASNLGNVITITNVFNGNSAAATANTSGFGVSSVNGSLPADELIANANNVVIFPLTETDVATIAATVNAGQIVKLVAVGSSALTIEKATREDIYVYGGNSTALGYGHNPTVAADRNHVKLYDSVNWVKSFQNSNPNFTLKTTFTLNLVAPSVYALDTAPNDDTASLGEQFKLIPVSVKNIHHHLTQKALSQLPIISNVRISQDRKNVQITSKSLGSDGSIEVIGGNANKAQAYLVSESEVSSDINGNFLLVKTPAFPDTFNAGDLISIQNDAGVKRFSRLINTDKITVTNPSSGIIEYNYNPKAIGVLSTTAFTITDVSGSYGRPAGYVWRWTHGGGGVTLAQVRAGDQVFAFGPSLSYDQGNKVRVAGDGQVAGLPIIFVNDASNYMDVLNPYGKTMPVVFTVASANATAGATYTHGGLTFTVLSTIAPGVSLTMSGPVPTSPSGTLTKTSGAGDATITFTSYTASTIGVGLTFTANTNFGTFLPANITLPSTITFANTFTANQQVSFSSTGTLPSGLQAGIIYYVVNPTGANFQVSNTPSGAAINLITIGSGTHTVVSAMLTAVSSTVGLIVGQYVTGVGIPTGTQITNIGTSTVTMSNVATTAGTGITVSVPNTVQVCPTPIIKWNLTHAAKSNISSMSRIANVVTVVCDGPHMLNTGDSADIADSNNLVDSSYGPITSTSTNQFTFASVGANFAETNVGSTSIKTGLVPTRYRLEKLGFNSLIRISRTDGESPRFTDCGVALDDYVVIGGSTFKSNNNGRFRVLAVDNSSMILINESGSDELNTTVPFNNKSLYATWTANTNVVTGVAGTFKYLNIGDWVKKPEDPDSLYRQVLSFSPGTPSTATSIILGGNYGGSSAIAPGVSYDMLNDYDKGVILQGIDDIIIYEGDAAATGDSLFVQNIVNTNWFSVNNIGNFEVNEVGTNIATYKPFIRISNSAGIAESSRLMSVDTAGFYLIEGLANKFSSIRKITHAILDDLNDERRSIYLTPSNRSYKFSDVNATSITNLGKLGYNTNVTTGIDGYLYYTGLLRRVQRIVDGYEPDADNFPGRRAVGGAIETLPPLNRRIMVTIDVTTDEGVNLGDISNNIKSTIINYIGTLGVGEDVILSEMIAAVMQIKGVAAVTFTNPVPSTERITITSNEKATITPNDIGIA